MRKTIVSASALSGGGMCTSGRTPRSCGGGPVEQALTLVTPAPFLLQVGGRWRIMRQAVVAAAAFSLTGMISARGASRCSLGFPEEKALTFVAPTPLALQKHGRYTAITDLLHLDEYGVGTCQGRVILIGQLIYAVAQSLRIVGDHEFGGLMIQRNDLWVEHASLGVGGISFGSDRATHRLPEGRPKAHH